MKWQLVFLLFFLLPIVNGIEYYVTKINDCVTDLKINVTGVLPINVNEYVLKNCNESLYNYWICGCSKPIIIDTANNAINNYTFTITYISQHIQKETRKRSSGGGYYYNPNVTYNDSIFTNPILLINQSDITYPFYNITTEYKTEVYTVNPQPLNQPAPIVQTITTTAEDKRTIWQQFIDILIKILHLKLW